MKFLMNYESVMDFPVPFTKGEEVHEMRLTDKKKRLPESGNLFSFIPLFRG
jgi:hypothetical protein